MANTIKLRRSATTGAVPTTGNLALGELAMNTADGKLFMKTDDGAGNVTIAEIGASGGGASITIASSPPSSPAAGDIYWDQDDGSAYIYYIDADSTAQWVPLTPLADTPVPGSNAYKIDDISSSFNGVLTDFTINVDGSAHEPAYINATLISLGGVIQQPTTAYTISGSTISFATAPSSGVDFFGIDLAAALPIGTPNDGTVTSAKIVDGTIVNVDINASAAIAGTKVSPNFGSQNVLTTGNVGIGTTSPSKKLHIVPSGSDAYDAVQIGDGLYLGNTSNNINAALFHQGGGADLEIGSQQHITFTTGGIAGSASERMRIDSSGRLLVGTSSARSSLGAIQVEAAGTSDRSRYEAFTNINSASGTHITLGKSRGTTAGSNTLVAASDEIGALNFHATDGSTDIRAAQIKAVVDGTPGANDMPGRLVFSTTADGAPSPTERMRINSDGTTTFTADATINSLTVGRGAGNVSTNTAVGTDALNANTTGGMHVANGYQALYSNTTGSNNVANGKQALRYNTTGSNNVATGFESLRSNTTGSSNVATGVNALRANTTGEYNIAAGVNALYANTTGNQNVAVGRNALYTNTTGGNNVANGYEALYSNTTGDSNTANGRRALYSNTEGNYNTANGFQALRNSTTAANNTANGYQALALNTTGSNNTANGYNALFFNTTGNNNVANGHQALESNTTGNHNTANGNKALYYNSTGNHNTANGDNALYNNTTGNHNTANGNKALYINTTGASNVASGDKALYSNTTGNHNTANGYHSLYNNTTGGSNVANGYQALESNTTGNNNTATGNFALYNNTTGYNNVGIGYNGLYNNTTGSGNIGIGFLNNAGLYAPVFNPTTESSRLVLGHTAITNAYVKVSWTVTSDERDKMNFAPVPYGLDFVNQLKPTAYQFKVDRDTETPNGDVRYGFKAQDILALEGDNPVIIDTEDADHLKYKGEHLVPVLVNAVQELTTMVKELQNEVAALKSA